jgi:hypothetical protein
MKPGTANPNSHSVTGREQHGSAAGLASLILGYGWWSPLVLLLLTFLCDSQQCHAQAPGLLWRTRVGGRAFAVDNQTNVYVGVSSNVITVTGDGVPFATNTICPLGGVAQRDAEGNYYFGGSFDGTQNFGGITLVGGWTNWPSPGRWSPGYPTCYLAKYTGGGSLVWVASFGTQAARNVLTDILLDPSGGCYAAHWTQAGNAVVSHISSTGTFDWATDVTVSTGISVPFATSLGGATTSNACFLAYRFDNYIIGGRIDRTGSAANLGAYPLRWSVPDSTNSKPVIDAQAAVFEVGICFNPLDPSCSAQELRLCGPGSTELWTVDISPDEQWTLAGDSQSHVYLGGTNGLVEQYDETPTLIWSNNFGTTCQAMLIDTSGNRFLSFADGTVARLQTDVPSLPILNIALSAGNVVLSWTNTGFSLQTRSSFTPGVWMDATNSIVQINGTSQVSVPAAQGGAFFRLQK